MCLLLYQYDVRVSDDRRGSVETVKQSVSRDIDDQSSMIQPDIDSCSHNLVDSQESFMEVWCVVWGQAPSHRQRTLGVTYSLQFVHSFGMTLNCHYAVAHQ